MATPPVPNRHAKQTRFLAAVAQGRSPSEAAALAGVPLPTFYTWRHKHTRFRDAWNRAVTFGRTPPFPSTSRLAAMNIAGPKTHWGWVPGGFPLEEPQETGDRVAIVTQSFGRKADTVIYYTVQPDGAWKEDCRALSSEPLPEGVSPPHFRLASQRLQARLPQPRIPLSQPS
jgi:hypothetical protein